MRHTNIVCSTLLVCLADGQESGSRLGHLVASSDAHSTERQISFGVACFRFSYWDEESNAIEPEAVLEAARATLEALPAVNNLETRPSLFSHEIVMDQDLRPSLQDGHPVVSPRAEQFDFDLYVPERVQAALFEAAMTGLPPDTGTERFRVHIRDTFHGEVAYVQPLEPDGEHSPSSAVQVVREFLRGNFKDPAGRVQFETLGPSPFHAEFHLALGSVPDGQAFSLELTRPRGYADLRFVANDRSFHSLDKALDELLFELSDQLGLFYEVTALRAQAIREWGALGDQIERLLEKRNTPTQWRRRHSARRLALDDLMNDLARFEIAQAYRQSAITEHRRNLNDPAGGTHLSEFVNGAIKEFPQYPTEQVGRVLAFHWNRRQKRMEYAVAVVSALVGVAGTLLTLAAIK